jgi:hypothetical protein
VEKIYRYFSLMPGDRSSLVMMQKLIASQSNGFFGSLAGI